MARNELQGRRGMRVLTLAASAVVAMLTAACGTSYRDNNDPVPSDAPVISYRYVDSEDRALAAEFADNYCEEAYGKDADEFDTDREPGGYEVSFACRRSEEHTSELQSLMRNSY